NMLFFFQLYWPALSERIEQCKMAGKNLNLDCANFLRVLHFYNQTHLYVCGTGAFHPRCAYIDTSIFSRDEQLVLHQEQTECGKGKCPYDPQQRIASAMIDGELYAGISSDFMSRDVAFFRSLGRRHVIRTEQYDSKWLQDPRFVKVHANAESNNEEDDKVYLFFTERAQEADGGNGKVIYSRVARVCKNDIGGQRSLVNKWSTFLKARLVCSIQSSEGIQTHFDELQDIFVLRGRDEKNPRIFGVFTTSSNILNGSAVCVYQMEDIVMAFKGQFSHKEGPDYKWVPYPGRVPFPRPGTCPSSTYGNYRSTRQYPDEAIFFIRTHPLMHHSVYPINQQPVLVRVGVDYKFTRIVVDRAEAVDGQYDVMFVGTGRQYVRQSSLNIVFQHWLYLGSKSGLAQVSFYQCDLYGKGCAECCLARDPYCTWNGKSCSRYKIFYAHTVQWNLTLQVTLGDQIIPIEQGLLIRQIDRRDAGVYHCEIEDHGFRWTLVKVQLLVVSANQLGNLYEGDIRAGGPIKERSLPNVTRGVHPWYKDIMALINYPSKMDFYCERVWQRDLKKKRNKLRLNKNHRNAESNGRKRMLGGGGGGGGGRRNKNKDHSKYVRSPRSIQ
uniref:Sema domain, immunoglobulin domain (Ig), short basic domain, secreted, (semaphorin) 3H n=1 Tax=Callorhinchus milii TaxID=7868 RepID=A0A4W3KL10_CALMI